MTCTLDTVYGILLVSKLNFGDFHRKNLLTNRIIFMSNYIMTVDLFGNGVRAETNGNMVSLTDLMRAGNLWRIGNNLSPVNVRQVLNSKAFQDYHEAAASEWDMPKDAMLGVVGRGNKSRTMGHISLAVFVAEQLSPQFHAKVIKTFVEGKLLEFRDQGGTEFKHLNAAIDLYLPCREGRDNRGIYINTAKILRLRLLGADSDVSWDSATVAQTHARYEAEGFLVKALGAGLVRDWDHLKELIHKV